MVDRASLTAEQFPCEKERKVSLRCGEKYPDHKEKKANCQPYFDEYLECKRNYLDQRNAKNYELSGGPPAAPPQKVPEKPKATPW